MSEQSRGRTSPSRRRFVSIAAAAGLIGVAGCLDQGGEQGDPEEDGQEPGDESDGGSGVDAEEWEDVDEIALEGQTEGWIGVEPGPIADEENPTLVLTEGEQYEVTWENADGMAHNFAIHDESGEHIEQTERMDEEGETQTLEFEARSEMDEYVCEPHENTMHGDVQLE